MLPGIGPVATIAMLLPITFNLSPMAALIMLAGIYYGAQYGGSTTAILVNLPGESASVVTCLDGYQMARQGRAGPALATAAIGSFFAGCVATLLIAVAAPPLAEVALKFGPAEYFSLMVLGLVAATVLAHGSLIKAIAHGGARPAARPDRHRRQLRRAALHLRHPGALRRHRLRGRRHGHVRHSPRSSPTSSRARQREVFTGKVKNLLPTKDDFKRMWAPILRGTALGSFLGILPGGGALLASFGAYTLEKKISKHPERVRQGRDRGRGGARGGEQRRRADLASSRCSRSASRATR